MMKISINSESDLTKVASEITCNSELFGDEVDAVRMYLCEVLNDAEKFGTIMSREITDMWGGNVKVTAYPSKRSSSWSF